MADVPAARAEPATAPVPHYPLGVARGQVAATYIVAEAEDGLVIVDQHAAHERLVLERMRKASNGGQVARQALLMPDVVELDEPECDRLEAAIGDLAELGLEIERFGPTAMLVRATPAPLGKTDIPGLLADLAAELAELGTALASRPPRPCRRDHGLPRLGARGPDPVGRGNERASPRNGGHAAFGPVQPWPPDLGEIGPCATSRSCSAADRPQISASSQKIFEPPKQLVFNRN